jgi:tetratricopeptide (TPR) repeat protein
MERRRQLVAVGLSPRVVAGGALVGLYLAGLGLVLGAGWLLVGLAVVALVLAAATFGQRGLEAVRDAVARPDADLGLRMGDARAAARLTTAGRAVGACFAASVPLAARAVRRLLASVRDLGAAPGKTAQLGWSRRGRGGAAATVAAPALRRLATLLRSLEPAAAVRAEPAAAIARRWLARASVHLTAVATTSGEREATAARGDDLVDQALELNRLGSVARREGRPEEAIEAHSWALKLVRELGNRREEARTLGNLALVLAEQDPDAAIGWCEQALAIIRELGETRAEGQVLASIAVLHHRAGRGDDAIACWQSALECFSAGSAEHARIAEKLRFAGLTGSDGTGARPAAGASVGSS